MNERLEKKLCYALRHHPERFDLILDDEGFCPAEDVCRSFNISHEVLDRIVSESDKKRFELKNGKIRALYGHSIPLRINKEVIIPPGYLYHGTTKKALEKIMEEGLKPMNRQYVHLSYDIGVAKEVGLRRDEHPVILRIDALKAYENSIHFYEGNERTVLADAMPSEYLKVFVPANNLGFDNNLYKGIFWIVDRDDLEENEFYLFKILTDRDGNTLAAYDDLNSKKGDNYNHRLTWQLLPKELTHNKPYNYYPRGRVEIKNNTAKIFISPLLNEERIIDYIKSKFNLNENIIGEIRVLVDNSAHYKEGS